MICRRKFAASTIPFPDHEKANLLFLLKKKKDTRSWL